MTSLCQMHYACQSRFRQRGRLALVRQAVGAVCERTTAAGPFELSIRLADDEVLRRLNLQYRGMDKPTDVLSFGGDGFRDGHRVAPSPAPRHQAAAQASEYLGDIAISMDRCTGQAQLAGHPVDAELTLLVVHGTLHLLGYDHGTRRRKALMWAAQSRALRSIGFDIAPNG